MLYIDTIIIAQTKHNLIHFHIIINQKTQKI